LSFRAARFSFFDTSSSLESSTISESSEIRDQKFLNIKFLVFWQDVDTKSRICHSIPNIHGKYRYSTYCFECPPLETIFINDSYSPEFSSNPTSTTSSFESIGNGGLLRNALNTLLFSYDIDFGAEI